MEEFIFREECSSIIGCAMEVHKTLGSGFLEAVYQETLSVEFEKENIPFEKEKVLNIEYKGIPLSKKYIADFFCYEQIIVELKAVENLCLEHTAQVLNYLKATDKKLGLLINFGNTKLQYRRIII